MTQPWDAQKLHDVAEFVGSRNSTAMVMLLHGRVVQERYWRGRKRDDVSDCFSVAKSVVSLLACVAQGKGLDSTRAVSDLLGQQGWSKSTVLQEERIRMTHLLSMSSGLDDELCFVAKPGTRWHYNLGIAWHLIKEILIMHDEQAGGSGDLQEFALRTLFEPIGAHTATFQTRSYDPAAAAKNYGMLKGVLW